MPTTAGPLDLISMIIDRWISFWTIIASLTARVTTNNRVSSASGSQLVTRQMPNASTSRICLCFENVDDDSYRLHPLFMFCKKFSILYNFYNFSDISFQLISTKRSLARYSSKTEEKKFTTTSTKNAKHNYKCFGR